MIAGFSGHLVSESFLDGRLAALTRQTPAMLGAQVAASRRSCRSLGPASSLRALVELGAEPLIRALGFQTVEDVRTINDSAGATLMGGSRPIALVVTCWGQPLDPMWRRAVVEAKRRQADWCLLFNGTHVRLVDARRVHSRRHAQFDLDLVGDHERGAAALWVLLGASSLSGATGESPLATLIAESERHGSAVCRALREGVLSASTEILGALYAGPKRSGLLHLRSGRHASGRSGARTDLHATFEQALTIVYRILFLLFAEARGLVPLWHHVYRNSYSLETLQVTADAPANGLWDALRAISRLAHSGCRAGDLRVTPFNGRLFAPARTPLAERRNLDDEAARRAVLALATRRALDGAGRERIAYRDLGVEQLGAVYETLLDYAPAIVPSEPARHAEACRNGARAKADGPARRAPAVCLQHGSGLRKATGTFYTPQPIAEYLVRRTLGPLVNEALPDRILALKIVDPAMGSGAFLVAACHYLAQAYEAALVRAGGCLPSDFGPAEQASIRRLIAERCLYGVDMNPMAVQLARLSIWLTTLAADRPLTFLDHHLQSGDSLLGAWLGQLRRAHDIHRRARNAEALPLFDMSAVDNALRETVPVRFTLASVPDDTLDQVRTKERALAALRRRDAALSKWKRVADLWCARWFWAQPNQQPPPASAFAALSDRILTNCSALPPATTDRYLAESEAIAAAHRFFHWELEFPEVFFDEQGRRLQAPGFDAVIGNPPWDMIRADSGASADRAQLRTEAKAVVRFTRDAGVYASQSDGHANRYQLFLERAMALTRAGGRLGLVLPSGLTADHGSARLRRRLFADCAVDGIVGFENRHGVFPIHRSVRFVLLTATAGNATREIRCRLGERDPSILERADDEAADWFPIRLSIDTLSRLTGDDLALPELTTPIDLTIAERAASLFPPLGETRGWSARFGRELNATDDRQYFRDNGDGHSVVEGRHIGPFLASLNASRWKIAPRDAERLLAHRHRHARLAYRDVASSTNRMTLIAALLPANCVSTHTVFCLRTPLPRATQDFLCGLFNSFVLNYLVRLRVATHVTTAIVERLPVPRAERSPVGREISSLARWLAGPRDDDRRRAALARLNALVAALYQISVEEFAYLLGTFPLVPEHERDAALRAFKRLQL